MWLPSVTLLDARSSEDSAGCAALSLLAAVAAGRAAVAAGATREVGSPAQIDPRVHASRTVRAISPVARSSRRDPGVERDGESQRDEEEDSEGEVGSHGLSPFFLLSFFF